MSPTSKVRLEALSKGRTPEMPGLTERELSQIGGAWGSFGGFGYPFRGYGAIGGFGYPFGGYGAIGGFGYPFGGFC